MTSAEREAIEQAVGNFGIECAAYGDNQASDVLVARGALMVLLEGMLERRDERIRELETARGAPPPHPDNLTVLAAHERRKYADRIAELTRCLEVARAKLGEQPP